jgi:SAM-dependent methyltransferase
MRLRRIHLQQITRVIERRGIGYLGYLVTGVAVPRLAYRYVWGPRVFAPIRRAFGAVAARLTPAAVTAIDTSDPPDVLMDRLHRAGITGVRHLFDGRSAPLRRHTTRGVTFDAERNADRCAFNERFGASLMTEAAARALLRRAASRVTNGYRDYAPIDFGGGLTLGRFARTDSGTGRWHFFNRTIVGPLVRGARVLDLGCNNGSQPLMMLRAGARAVVGIEASPAIADLARANARILEWRDMAAYDFRVITGDMRMFLTADLGRFDLVSAFCSLYYLPVPDIARVIARAAASGATLVLQANDAIANLPASARRLRALMVAHGYPATTVYEYPGFPRALLVGSPPARPAP